MKKPLRGLLAACIIAVIVLGLGYVTLAMYYRDSFTVNTWINGIYCTGSSVEEVDAALLEQTSIPKTLTVIGYNQTGEDCKEVTWTLSMDELMLTVEYGTGLRKYFSNQDPWSWTENLTSRRDHILLPNRSFSEVVLQEKLEQIVASSRTEADYSIGYNASSGYVLYDGIHNRVDEDKVMEVVKAAIMSGSDTVNLIESGCYYDATMDSGQKNLCEVWQQIKKFQSSGPVYDFGSVVLQMESADMASFLKKDDNTLLPLRDKEGRFILKEECAQDWVAAIAAKYDTYGKTWEFTSTRGEIVAVEGKTYGSTINQEREAIWLTGYLENLIAGKSVTALEGASEAAPRVPEYSRKAYNGTDELGDTYIEVDMGAQKLYYYKDGMLLIETDVVTGNMRRRWDTPEGVNYVYNKQKNRILRGEGYATPVDFWMPVNGAIGIHDADWRSEFGGDEYKTNGSHGCVNVPKEVMPELYEFVEIGTPVVMFYGSDPLEEAVAGN